MVVELEFITPTWDRIFDLCVEGAGRIMDLDVDFDLIVALSRGGLVPGRILSDLLAIHDVIVLDVKYYTGVGERADKPKINEMSKLSIKDKNVLVADDVVDTGESVKAAVEYLRSLKPKNLTIFTMHAKPHRIIEPDIFIEETNAWIIYPWETLECISDLESRGMSLNQIAKETGIKRELLRKVGELREKNRRNRT
jgi:hypoxanthine phosphoribosyltransferase